MLPNTTPIEQSCGQPHQTTGDVLHICVSNVSVHGSVNSVTNWYSVMSASLEPMQGDVMFCHLACHAPASRHGSTEEVHGGGVTVQQGLVDKLQAICKKRLQLTGSNNHAIQRVAYLDLTCLAMSRCKEVTLWIA